MENATYYTWVKVPITNDDGLLLDARSCADDMSPLRPNPDGGRGVMQINKV